MPAYENLATGDLLKVVNDGGTYKLKKIYGIQNPLTGSAPSQVKGFLRAYEISTDKILITYANSSYGTENVYAIIGNISGSTITFVGNTKVTTENLVYTYGAASCMVNTNKVLVVGSWYSSSTYPTYARICSVSNNTISVSSELQLWSDASRLSDSVTISTDKAVVQYYLNDHTKIVAIDTSGATPTMGAAVEVYNTAVVGPHTTYKIANNKTISIYCKSSNYTTYGVIGTISGTNITTGSAQAISQIGHTSNNYLSSCNIIYVSDDYSVIAWTESGSGNTYYGIITVSGTTFSLNAITPLSIGTNACLVDRFLYASEYPNTKHKVTFNSSGQFNLVTTVNLNGSLVPRLNNTILLYVNGFETTQLMLLDHDEFVTSANDAYTAGDSVPLTDRFTGFSGLANGLDYYINADASGLTIDSTYQKVGKAINDTTILKG